MILADKIIILRKENDWSQEQLAEQLGVTRQSVSKWESGAAIPGLDLIVRMSDLFGVSVDYLVKEEMEDIFYTHEETVEIPEGRLVTTEEANAYMELVRQVAGKIAVGVAVCILSPVLLLFLGGLTEYANIGISEDMAGGIGVTILLCMVAFAVMLFIMYGMKLGKYEYLEKEQISLGYGAKGMIEKKQSEFEDEYRRSTAGGVILCIVGVIPLIMLACMSVNDFYLVCGVDILLIMVAVGVYRIVLSGSIWGSYQKLLQEGDYTIENKAGNKKVDGFAGIYWCLITAVYLGISFYMKNWHISWIIWPVAGVLFGAISGVIKLISTAGKKHS